MKKIIHGIIVIIILLALGLCVITAWSWFSLEDTKPPEPQITVNNQLLSSDIINWAVPILGGVLKRDFHWENNTPQTVRLAAPGFEVTLPKGYENAVVITKADEEIFSGEIDGTQSFFLSENGSYTLDIALNKAPSGNLPYGQIFALVTVIVDAPPPKPTLKVSSDSVVQGDTVAIELENLPVNEVPIVETTLSMTTFMQLDKGHFIAYVGIADSHDLGKYEVKVKFTGFEETVQLKVLPGNFKRQDLTIDITNPAISEANSTAAYQQYRDSIRPVYETSDPTHYWNGSFLKPTEGRLSSEYGLLRYTNGGATPGRHAGIDIAAGEGTPIIAPADGRVVFSDYLLNTGNTLVIEHGGGLKTYYFHLSERSVKVDDKVTASQLLGKIGTTGYSTGPHLHFEVRIGNQNLDPFKFFEGTGGCFTE